jgi:hypothetical protein
MGDARRARTAPTGAGIRKELSLGQCDCILDNMHEFIVNHVDKRSV